MNATAADEGLSVAQMAHVTGISAHTLRYYERTGLLRAIERTSGNQRRYRAGDIEWVRFLLRLRDTGMSIAKMRRYAELRAAGESTLEARMAMLQQQDAAVSDEIRRLQENRRALRDKVSLHQAQIDAANENERTNP
jgi:DNA-binding transcriptional MerR regulator